MPVTASHYYMGSAAVKVEKVKDKGDPAKRAAAAAARKGVVAQPDGHAEGQDAEKVTLGPGSEELLKKVNVSG